LAILEIIGLTKRFGGVLAMTDVDLEVPSGEILGIIGPNGAGKTTLFNSITGFHRPTRGQILFEGKDITGMKPNTIASLGLVRTFQLVSLMDKETALENVRVACHLRRNVGVLQSVFHTPKARQDDAAITAQALELMEQLGLIEVKDDVTSSLPHGLRRLLGLCVALATRPKLLLLDEPTAGMSASETNRIMDHIQGVRSSGVTVMLVEHDMSVIMTVCDRIMVLSFGKKIAEGTPREIASNKDVISAYLGFETENEESSP
jgi:branched-chain amino acid transport system ATP-binding protein